MNLRKHKKRFKNLKAQAENSKLKYFSFNECEKQPSSLTSKK